MMPEWIKKLEEEDMKSFIFGTTKYLLESTKENKTNLNILVTPCNEGDNSKDAIEMTARVLAILKQKVPIKLPISWKSFYGPSPNSSLY
jgi:hypothetical protein